MCKVMEEMRNETATATNIVAIKNIMNKLSYTVEQAMDQTLKLKFYGLVLAVYQPKEANTYLNLFAGYP